MQTIISARGGGKTTKLLQMLDNYNGYMVCSSMKEVDRVYRFAKDTGYKINQPITFEQFLSGEFYYDGVGELCVDNADLLLEQLGRGKIKAITITNTYGD